ncbi:NAD-dependent epimerase/dehydratase family protein [Paralcaligenes sp. KSB-10]|uniref:NAD-dependent epimerase/dehydratase family protein n=1 Tax=Paralcaligenes sp. KSB-10 TaxID=2901142 RepID=UPI001E4E509B|nr:NAD-dependent epimerase/dehydratase family protein [Paralcaligenes sp. KSB-10]UHL62567.1 NAD-dependent epimerase/dehydratase family protein [Paralcaligenes sp. KSB-10]
MAGKRVLLAGAGDLCLRAAQLLLKQGDAVWGLRRHPPKDSLSGIQWLAGDLTEDLDCLPADLSHVIYAPTPDRRNEAAYRAVFMQGLQHLLAALNHQTLQRFLFISSSAVYGPDEQAWVDEATPPDPRGFNGEVLMEAERWLAAEVPCAIRFRLAGLYGPGRVALLERLRLGKVTVPRQAAHWANRFHIDDAARASVHLLELDRPESCYIGADNRPHKIDELYDALARMLDAGLPPDAPMSEEVGSKRLSNARLRASGFEPAWPDAIEGYRALISRRAPM